MALTISVPTGWKGKSGVPPKVVHFFRKIPFDPRDLFTFQPIEHKIVALGSTSAW